MAFLPSVDLGISVLTNGRATNVFNEAVRYHLLELVYGLEPEYEQTVQFVLDSQDEAAEELSIQYPAIDLDEMARYLGTWTNPELGEVDISITGDGTVVCDAGEFASDIRAYEDDEGELVYFSYDPPLPGLPFDFGEDDDGNPVLIIGYGVDEYAFEKVE
jgi:hypothetical protein